MRVLHVITGLAEGGAEHQLRLLLRRLPLDCEVAVLTNPGSVAAAIRADGRVVHELDMRGNRDVAVVPRLRALIRSGRFDVVHTHLYRACVHGRVAARLAGVDAVVATEHSLGDGVIEGRRTTAAVRALYLATERLGRATVAVSDAVAARLRAWGVPAGRITVVPNGLDAAEFAFDPALRAATRAALGIPADAPVLGGLGRLHPGKRFDTLVAALPALPGVTLLLAGDGPARADLERAAAAHGVADRVVFAGAVTHARAVLCATDVLASPSPHETFGLAVLEGLACGLPVHFAACPPLEAAAPGDAPGARRLPADPAAYAAALRADLDRGPARRPVPAVVDRYDTARLAAAVGELYARLAGRPRRPVHIGGARP